MALINIPTSADIYIEVHGRRVAAAQSYKVTSARESRYIEAFGSQEPVATVGGRIKHKIQLTRVELCGALEDGVDFYDLEDFNLVIVKPGRKVIYSGCQWAEITQGASVNEVVLESAVLVASRRMALRPGQVV